MTVAETREFRRSLSRFELVSLGVGGTIGSGIFVVPGIAAGIGGPASLLGWLLVGVSASCVAYSLAALLGAAPPGTAFAELFRPAFGARAAAGIATLYLAGSVFGIATVASGLGQYLSYFAVPHGPWVEAATIAAFLIVNLAGIAVSGVTEDVLTLLKIAALVAIALALAPFVEAPNLSPGGGVAMPAMLQVVILVYWPFTGFEISAIPIAETRAPEEIPRALLVVMLLVCGIYLALNVTLMGAVGAASLAASPAPVAEAMGRLFTGAGPVVAVIALVTMASALNAYVVGASRVLQSLAQAFGPGALATLSARGVPGSALISVCATASALLFVSDRFASLATAAVLTTLVPYVALCVAAVRTARSARVSAVALFGAVSTAAMLVLFLCW